MNKTVDFWQFVVPLDREPYYFTTMTIEQEDPPHRKARTTVELSLSDIEANPEGEALQDLIKARLECAMLWLEDEIASVPA